MPPCSEQAGSRERLGNTDTSKSKEPKSFGVLEVEPRKIIDDGEKITSLPISDTTTDYVSYFWLLCVIGVTFFTFPHNWGHHMVTWQHVWYYGWITAISTGMGVVPFFFMSKPSKVFLGISNAVAGGMMVAASYSLIFEGATFLEEGDHSEWSAGMRTLVGFCVGVVFIVLSKKILEQHEDIEFGDVKGASAQKMVLIIFVMTLHSLSEGIGIGVSFGGKHGHELGQFISLSLAMHNVPEGLAVALVMTSRGVSNLKTGLWAVFTSLPQPLTAVPAYIFVHRCISVLPVGLGFAAGAMSFVAVFELLAEAIEDTGVATTAIVGTISCAAMLTTQYFVKGSL